jgi:hypothetical protein
LHFPYTARRLLRMTHAACARRRILNRPIPSETEKYYQMAGVWYEVRSNLNGRAALRLVCGMTLLFLKTQKQEVRRMPD